MSEHVAVFRYYTPYRPPSPGAVPKGFVHIKVWGSRPFIAEAGTTVWGAVDYEKPLSQQEVYEYELIPANVVQAPLLIPIREVGK